MFLVYGLYRVLRNGAYAGTLRERLGFLPERLCKERGGAVWIHAVSVGEVIAAGTLVREMRKDWAGLGNTPVFVSATTLGGYATARDSLGAGIAGVFYAPLDWAWVIRRVLRRLQPSMVVVLETEIWPNLFREAKRAGCGLIIANGRISDQAAGKYERFRWFFRHVLCWPDRILVQSEPMRARYIGAGAPENRVEVAGNLKYDFEAREADPDSPVAVWLAAGEGPVLIAASTTADGETDEDRVALVAWEQSEGWRLILAPRRPERFPIVAELLKGTRFWRRSAGRAQGDERILLLDTMGELASLFPFADVVFQGGTLTETGGHNFLEPALAGKPVIVGPRLENFREIAEDFRAHEAFLEIANGGELPAAVRKAFEDLDLGERGRARAEAHRGAARATVACIRQIYGESLFHRLPILPARLLLTPLARIWKAGSARRQAREFRNRRALNTPVISIGNITAGGTGKTPFVLHLAKRFRERGFEPVVLTRGYGRISHRERLLLPRGTKAAVRHTGDEPQILLRSGWTGLAVAGDRYLAGWDAEAVLHPDVFLVDDGFSHQRLARDVDVVLVDSLDPFGGSELLPLGRLREPLEAMRRADIFVITRCSGAGPLQAIEHRLREFNERAPIFRSRLVTREWIAVDTEQPGTPPARPIAFCGLGNPGSFWNSIDELGIEPLDRFSYGDHHQYAPRELHRLARYARASRAGALLTTEKDVVNFPEDAGALFEGLPVFFLRVDVEVEDEPALLRLLDPAQLRARQASNRRPLASR